MRTTYRTILAVLTLDQLTKWAFKDADLVLLPDVVALRGVKNTGAAFGVLAGRPWLLSAVGILMFLVLLLYLHKERPGGLFGFGLALVAAGALGNVIDRVLLQYVIDFIELLFVRFAVFNVADIAVTVGCGLCALGLLLDKEPRHG